MKKATLCLLSFIVLLGCNTPDELPVPDYAKPADQFSRAFINKIITGQVESAYGDVAPEMLDDNVKEFISNAARNINGAIPGKYRVVELNWITGLSTSTGKSTNYRLGYEFEFEKGNILFTTTINKRDGTFSVIAFNGEFLPAPLSEITKFTLKGKSPRHYFFLFMCVSIPLFIATTCVLMLFGRMSVKRKIIWSLIILLVALPRFVINWNTGETDFTVLNITLLGGGVHKPTLYSPWLLSFNFPVGAIIFWFRRRSLLQESSQQPENAFVDTMTNTGDKSDNERTKV